MTELTREDEIDVFSFGDCWRLAQAVSALGGGLPLVGVGLASRPVGNWLHIGVRLVDGRILDVHGARSAEDFEDFWHEHLESTLEYDYFGEGDEAIFEVETYLFDLDPAALQDQEPVHDLSGEEIQAVALRLLREAGVVLASPA